MNALLLSLATSLLSAPGACEPGNFDGCWWACHRQGESRACAMIQMPVGYQPVSTHVAGGACGQGEWRQYGVTGLDSRNRIRRGGYVRVGSIASRCAAARKRQMLGPRVRSSLPRRRALSPDAAQFVNPQPIHFDPRGYQLEPRRP